MMLDNVQIKDDVNLKDKMAAIKNANFDPRMKSSINFGQYHKEVLDESN